MGVTRVTVLTPSSERLKLPASAEVKPNEAFESPGSVCFSISTLPLAGGLRVLVIVQTISSPTAT